ncbi:putative coiled-coil domain-containing protein [Sesbania bispinosa]|nr:putative coiled-coil domain-containing protein [Sesbania bispinosa]
MFRDKIHDNISASFDQVDEFGSPVMIPVGNKIADDALALISPLDAPIGVSLPIPSNQTPSKDDNPGWEAKSSVPLGDDAEMSATKMRKVIKQEKI